MQGRSLHAVCDSVLCHAVVHAARLHVPGVQRALVPGRGLYVRDAHECKRVKSLSPSYSYSRHYPPTLCPILLTTHTHNLIRLLLNGFCSISIMCHRPVTMVTAWRTIHRSVKLLPFSCFSQPCLIFLYVSCSSLGQVFQRALPFNEHVPGWRPERPRFCHSLS